MEKERIIVIDDAYQWVPFYEALADKLLTYNDKRSELFELMKKVASEQPLMKYLHFEREDWWGPRQHQIDPFSVIGVINRKTTDKNRTVLAKVLADAFEITLPVPARFDGIPVLNNMNSLFAGVDELWNLFVLAIKSVEANTFTDEFKRAFEKAIAVKGNGLIYITMGLYWIRPNVFMPLDDNSRSYISAHYGITVPKEHCSGDDYVKFLSALKDEINKKSPNISFPELSYTAWIEGDKSPQTESGVSITDNQDTLQKELSSKNIILYGPPGTGKTYSTVQYAVAIIEEKPLSDVKSEDYGEVFKRYLKYKNDGLIAFITFHQSFGYEEFIEGIRPVLSSEEISETGVDLQ